MDASARSAQAAALGEQVAPGRAVNRAVDPAAAQEGAVRRIDDGIKRERRDVGDHDVETRGRDFGGEDGLR